MKYQTISEIHKAFQEGNETPLTLTQSYLEKIKASNHNAYITVCEDRALKQAETSSQELKEKYKGHVPLKEFPLFGIPMGQKDVFTIEGVRTTCASRVLENYLPPYTSTVVKRLENAGAITLGKLNMDEFAMGSSNENSAYGPVLHPTHLDRVPGGSSGGSGAAVAADLCFAATGTDTGGSIRLPASFCGVVGFKPTYGRVSRYGLIAFASSLDQAGPLTHSVEDSARILDVIAGEDEMDCTSSNLEKPNWWAELQQRKAESNLKGFRVGVPEEYFVDGIDSEVRSAIEKSIESFRNQGAVVVPVSLPHTKYAVSTYYLVAVSEASSNLSRFDGIKFGVRPESASNAKTPQEYYKKVRTLFGEEVKRRIVLGTFALSTGYYDAYYQKACQARRLMRQDFENAFQQVDVIVSPVSPTTAFKLGEKSKNPLQMYLTDIFTIPASLAGLPSMSVPVGNDSGGLSIGLHIIGNRFNESAVFRAGFWAEKLRGLV